MQKAPPETNGLWTPFTFKNYRSLWAVAGTDSATDPLPLPLRRRKYYVYRWGDSFPTVEQHVPSNAQCSGSVSRNTPPPCFGGIQDAALAHKKGSLETLGFKWRSLGTFCCYWQKVTRRRQKKKELSETKEERAVGGKSPILPLPAKRTAPEISPGPFTVCDLLPSPEGAALHLVHGGDRRSGAGP